jgi:hypothetical protein
MRREGKSNKGENRSEEGRRGDRASRFCRSDPHTGTSGLPPSCPPLFLLPLFLLLMRVCVLWPTGIVCIGRGRVDPSGGGALAGAGAGERRERRGEERQRAAGPMREREKERDRMIVCGSLLLLPVVFYVV